MDRIEFKENASAESSAEAFRVSQSSVAQIANGSARVHCCVFTNSFVAGRDA
jgi:hypothetical protein